MEVFYDYAFVIMGLAMGFSILVLAASIVFPSLRRLFLVQ